MNRTGTPQRPSWQPHRSRRELFPAAKIICCVRPVPWIIDSIERQIQRNPFGLSGLFGYEPGGTVSARVTQVAGSNGLVGYALDALRVRAHSGRLTCSTTR